MDITKVNNINHTEQQSEQQKTDLLNSEQNNFKDELNALLAQNNISLSGADRNLLMNTLREGSTFNLNSSKVINLASELSEIKSSFNYNTMTMDKDDAIFFASLTQNIPAQVSVSNNEFSLNVFDEVKDTPKTMQASKTLMNIIENCYKTQQSARLDFDNNISVILKIDKSGKVSAEFIPSDKIAEQYLKNNIAFLRQTFDEENLPYSELSYREQNKKGNSSNNKNKDKEHE